MTPNNRMAILRASKPKPVTPELKKKNEIIMKRLPPNFGPGHPDWNIPSRRHKYLQTQGVTYAQARAKDVNPVNKEYG